MIESTYTAARPSDSIQKSVVEDSLLTIAIYRNAVRYENKQRHTYDVIKIKRKLSDCKSCLPWRFTATSIVIDPELFPSCLELEAFRELFLLHIKAHESAKRIAIDF